MCIDDSTPMRMAASPVTDSSAVTGCVAVPLFGRIFESTSETSNLENAASKSPNEGKGEILSPNDSRYSPVPSNQYICITAEQLMQFADFVAMRTVQSMSAKLDQTIDKSISRRLPSAMRATLRRVNGTNARGPSSKGKRKQVNKVIEYAATKNTSIHNACELAYRDLKPADGYKSEGALYCYCHDHEAAIEARILGKNPNWHSPTPT